MSTTNGLNTLRDDIADLADELPPHLFPPGSIGMTMFDQPGSEDGTLIVAGLLGVISGSWLLFGLAAAAGIVTSILDGDIRWKRRNN